MEQRLISLLNSTLHPNQVKQVHAIIIKFDANLNPLLIKFLLNHPPYIRHALKLFDTIPTPDPILTNSIISSCSKLSLHREALEVYFSSHRRKTQLAFFSVPSVLKACALLPAFLEGVQVHSLVISNGFCCNSFIRTALIDFYSKNDDLVAARKVFELVMVKDPIMYNCLLSGYSKAGEVAAARQLFDEMSERTLVTWNSMISCYAHSEDVVEGLNLFERMKMEKVEANEFTLVTVLSMCAKLGDLQMGLKIKKLVDGHERRKDLVVRTAVLEVLVKGGAVDEARQEFDQMEHRDIIAWTAMVSGYAQNGRPSDALELFEKMRLGGVKPNKITLVCILSACGQLGSVEAGERIGRFVESQEIASSVYVGSALLDMYAKCGNIRKAYKVFNEMPCKDVVSWNSMISGLAYNGLARDAIDLYQEMMKADVKPTELTFIGLLTACTHAGLVELGLEFYDSMKPTHKITPKVEHSACIVDLLCRSGRLRDAYSFICKMEVVPNVVIWGTLLSACRVYSNVELAERAMEKLIVLEPNNSANYVLLANIYASAGRWSDALKLRNLMKNKSVSKLAAYSWIELDNVVHKFLVGDTSHPISDKIYNIIHGLGLQLNRHNSVSDSELELMWDT